MFRLYFPLLLSLLLFTCKKSTQTKQTKSAKEIVAQKKEEHKTFPSEINFARYMLEQLQNGAADSLDPYVNERILFSPYAYIDSTAQQLRIEELMNPSDKKWFWGYADGTGDSINLSIPSYLQKFVFDIDFSNENVDANHYSDQPKAYGNSLQNAQEVFPKAQFVQFYKEGTKEYSGMDWKSVILVIEKQDQKPILRAIIHDQWTI